ncbi:uncharacterized protein AMSG_08477 [Thecamonas trahens ATCC 50062]|uniref:Bms1-type G domain-containing protein n=1 Tax=Thecamonas trahens ATCC 50062 TaxID=461836 RepID=A0A0L0DMK1_THETB|nr:hypothetical protein AMSG_08477 [Thecamonas trahens ATCC 50062]KNC52613.1 hypothetical protein AMSG_08477 [Thecamonas trahens ATCC 50062]|eukprot:XP_013755171.1 hypothetical protein AMSG_08477 [Thecamonas trahens ATCC 50062]
MEFSNLHAANKPHKKATKGKKREKKIIAHKKKEGKSLAKANSKAFLMKSGVKALRYRNRKADLDQKRLHVPLVNRTDPNSIPPIVVGVVGPPKVGKSTIIRSLVKHYTRYSLGEIKGPVTVVSSKARRLTFIEVPNELNAMIDAAKVCDLVLLVIDASYGFEMDTFEFLNIAQNHGFMKILGVLTHLDTFKDGKKQRKTRKRLKHRFWTEVYDGAKLFYLSSIQYGRYSPMEIRNLARFISIQKFRPIIWRNTHPYVLVDRVEDVTNPQDVKDNPGVDRNVVLYGYVRGTHLKSNMQVYIPGAGEYAMDSVTIMDDPCPLAERSSGGKRRLADRSKLLYAPLSDVGDILFDRDAVYIDLQNNSVAKKPLDKKHHVKAGSGSDADDGDDSDASGSGSADDGEAMVQQLADTRMGLDEQLQKSTFQLFAGGTHISTADVEKQVARERRGVDVATLNATRAVASGSGSSSGSDASGPASSDGSGSESETWQLVGDKPNRRKRLRSRGSGSDASDSERGSGSDDGSASPALVPRAKRPKLDAGSASSDSASSDDMGGARWKDNLMANAVAKYKERAKFNLMDLVYGPDGKKSDADDANALLSESDDEVRAPGANPFDDTLLLKPKASRASQRLNAVDSTRASFASLDDLRASISALGADALRARFVQHVSDADDNSDDDLMSSNRVPMKAASSSSSSDSGSSSGSDSGSGSGSGSSSSSSSGSGSGSGSESESSDSNEHNIAINMLTEMDRQKQLNLTHFASLPEEKRAIYEGYRAGTYVRIVMRALPAELMLHFDPRRPMLVCGVPTGETTMTFLRARIKRHRWHSRILKSNDPLIFSLGWRRFQTVPLYARWNNGRTMYAKYTPEHAHCEAVFYGPAAPVNSGFVAFSSLSAGAPGYRIAATGTLLEMNETFTIQKKIKLVGEPMQISKHTAFVKGMFSSPVEAARYERASVKTVSGIRGAIKRATTSGAFPPGTVRVTFEDRPRMSDIVFLRAWVPVYPDKVHFPVTNLLEPSTSEWVGAKTVGRLRFERGLLAPHSGDSSYTTIKRTTKRFNPLRLPASLEAALPFKSKPKDRGMHTKKKSAQAKAKAKKAINRHTAVVMDDYERKMTSLISSINAVRKTKLHKAKHAKIRERTNRAKRLAIEEEAKKARLRIKKKDYFRKESKLRGEHRKRS